MKRKRNFSDDQGSMLILMTPRVSGHHVDPNDEGRRPSPVDPEVAITHLVVDSEGNVLEMSHEPVLDPLDDPEELGAFECFYGDYNA